MSVRFPSGHRGRCPSIVFVTYSVEGHRLDVRAFSQRSPGTATLHRVRHIFGGGTLSRCPCAPPPHLNRQGLADLKHAGDDADRDQRDHQKCADQRAGRHQVGQ